MHHILLSQALADGQLGCFHLLVILNNAAMYMDMPSLLNFDFV